MIENGRISSGQLGIIMYLTVLSTAILLMPSITSRIAGRDMWMAPILASVVGLFTIWMACRLQREFPRQTLFQYTDRILGKFFGKTLILVFLMFHLHICGASVRDYAEFIGGNFLSKTPMATIMGSMLLVCAFAVRGGLEVIARCAQIFTFVVVILLVITLLFLIPDMRLQKVLPMLENGLGPPLLSSIVVQGWFCQFILVIGMLPFVKDLSRARKAGYIAVVITTISMVVVNICVLFVLGDLTPGINYSVLYVSRYIRISDFFEHLEAVVVMVWIMGAFIKLSVFYYVFVIGFANWAGLPNYRPYVFPIGLLIYFFGYWVAESMQELGAFIATSGTFYILTGYLGIPTLLLCVLQLRKWTSSSFRAKLEKN